MTKATWYFDFISPFAYLQLAQFSKLPSDLEITTVPVVFGGLLKHWGNLVRRKLRPNDALSIGFFNGNLISWVSHSRCPRAIPTILCPLCVCA